MRAVIQRVSEAKVEVEGKIVGQVGRGLLVYLGVGKEDTETDAQFMAEKLANLRIFADDAGKMNRSVIDIGGGVLLISNFTLLWRLPQGPPARLRRRGRAGPRRSPVRESRRADRRGGCPGREGLLRRPHARDEHQRRTGDVPARQQSIVLKERVA